MQFRPSILSWGLATPQRSFSVFCLERYLDRRNPTPVDMDNLPFIKASWWFQPL